jgi:HK97 gp10 family phage protein
VIAQQAENNCPVDTGYLRSTVFVQENGDDVEIGFEAPYASYVEFGTYKMAAQPFLRPAFDEAELQALSAIVDSVTKKMRDITK